MSGDKGFTLLEVLVAVVILAVGVASYMGMLSQKLDLLGRIKGGLDREVLVLELQRVAVTAARTQEVAGLLDEIDIRVQEVPLGSGPLVLKEVCHGSGGSEVCVRIAVARQSEASR